MKLPLVLPPREAKSFDAAGLGENSLDLLVVVPEHPAANSKHRLDSFAKLPGGEAATAMVACARQGWRARYIGRIGSDDHASAVEAALLAEGVDLSAVQRVDVPNRIAVVLVDASAGHRTVLWQRDPKLVMHAGDIDEAAVTSARVLMLDAHDAEASFVAARFAQAAGVPTVLDCEQFQPEAADLLGTVDVVVVSETFPGEYTGTRAIGEGLRKLYDELEPALAVVTLGENGSLAICGGEEIHTPGFRVAVVDPTGAGDAFRGGFIAGWLRYGQGVGVSTLLEYANAVAALNCKGLGAQGGLPTRAQVDALVTGTGRDRSN